VPHLVGQSYFWSLQGADCACGDELPLKVFESLSNNICRGGLSKQYSTRDEALADLRQALVKLGEIEGKDK
jgi:hypothetical protein